MPTFADLLADYTNLWGNAQIRPNKSADVTSAVARLVALKAQYDLVTANTGVPWFVIGMIHSLESSCNLGAHLHNGDPLTARTVQEPAGRPASGSPPFTWVESATDALKGKGLHKVDKDAWSIERIAYELERYNGFGYRDKHPNVKSPYLWSCTSQYTKGKYVGDHKFDANKESNQVGAMALLKQLIANGVVSPKGQSNLPAPPPPPPPVPVPTSLFFPDTRPFDLRAEPRLDAARGLRVMTDMTVKKLEKAADPWWKVEVNAPDGSKHVGFGQESWLTAQTVLSRFDEKEFTQTVLDVARHYGTSAHFLLALAETETGMANTPVAGAGDAFGPFALTEDDWKINNDPVETGFGDDGRFQPPGQAAVAARLVAKLAEDARGVLPDKRLATSEELYLARIFGVPALKVLVEDGAQSKAVREVLAAGLPDIDQVFARRPALLTAGITVEALRTTIRQKLDEAFEKAVDLILAVEPDLVIGPSEATGDEQDVPWMAKAREQMAKPVEEFPAGSNPEIEKFFADTTLGRQPDDVAWCAAFVSWCVKEAGGGARPITFSARAADWLANGSKLEGPRYGAIAVTRPLAAKSSGHVGFVVSWDQTKIKLLAGNQKNANGVESVCEKDFSIADVRGWRMV